jgi:hypothetical protein
MKKTLILLLLSLPLLGIAQTTNREFPPKESGKVQKDPSKREPYSNNFDTVTVEKTKRIVLTQKANNKLINQYMGKIVGTTNKADQLGNYASFDPALEVWPLRAPFRSGVRKTPVSATLVSD